MIKFETANRYIQNHYTDQPSLKVLGAITIIGLQIIFIPLVFLKLPFTLLASLYYRECSTLKKDFTRLEEAFFRIISPLSLTKSQLQEQKAISEEKERQADAALRARSRLPREIFESAKGIIESGTLNQFPTATNGKTPVYLLDNPNVVIKKSGSWGATKRFEKMVLARKICERLNLTALYIPRADVYEDYIIEERLPIGGEGLYTSAFQKFQMHLYTENKGLFDTVAEQFTEFLCFSHLTDASRTSLDFTGAQKLPKIIGHLGASPRYDNFSLYIEKSEGRIGLVDLEHLDSKDFSFSIDHGYLAPSRAKNAICIATAFFPLHDKEILQTVKKHKPDIEETLSIADICEETRSVANICEETRKVYEILHVKHLEFAKIHDLQTPKDIAKIPPNLLTEVAPYFKEYKKLKECEIEKLLSISRSFLCGLIERNFESKEGSPEKNSALTRMLSFFTNDPLYIEMTKEIEKVLPETDKAKIPILVSNCLTFMAAWGNQPSCLAGIEHKRFEDPKKYPTVLYRCIQKNHAKAGVEYSFGCFDKDIDYFLIFY